MAAKARLRLDGADPINKGLFGRWPMQESSGNVALDISPNRRNGAFNAFAARAVAPWGKTPKFVGASSNYVLGPTFPTANQVSVGFWLIADNAIAGGAEFPFLLDNNATSRLICTWDHPSAAYRQAWYMYDGATYPVAKYTTSLQPGVPYFVGASFDGTTLRIYLNGRYEAQTTISSGFGSASGAAMLLGGYSGAPFSGRAGNFMVWPRVVTPVEWARLYRDPWAGTARPVRRGYSAANAYSLTLDNVSREYGAGALGLTAARLLALDGVSREYGAGAANLTVARTLALDGVSRVYGAGDITLTKTRPMALDGVSRLYGADDMTMTYDGTGAGPHGVLRRRVRRRLWNDVPEDLKPVVALAEEWADESPVQRAVDEALDRYARISARASVARRDRLVDELKRAIVQAVERAAEADDEEALIALL